MIISRTPFRISLFGGGTDIREWYSEHGGCVLSFSINKYCWVLLRRLPQFFEYTDRIVWSKIELVDSVVSIENPIAREVLIHEGMNEGVEIFHTGDLPYRSGLGGSSSFSVGLLNAVRALNGTRSTSEVLAKSAIHIERDVLKEAGGIQDQIAAAYGGFNVIEIERDGNFSVYPLVISRETKIELNSWMMLFFTGFARSASEIEKKKVANFSEKKEYLEKMMSLVDDGIFNISNPDKIAGLLDVAWELKRGLADCVSTPEIDSIYYIAKGAGALGGKLLGAGGGGFILLMVPPEKQHYVREALLEYVEVPFKIGAEGSRIIVYDNGSG